MPAELRNDRSVAPSLQSKVSIVARSAAIVVTALLLAAASAAALAAAEPDNVVADVRAAVDAGNLARAAAIVSERRAAQGSSPEIAEAVSVLGSAALAAGDLDRAIGWARDAERLAVDLLGSRSVESDAHLSAALGASIEVQAQAVARQGDRSTALYFLQRELETYANTALYKKIQKNINLLTLAGAPAPALDLSESLGVASPTLESLKGRVVVLFFWAHWCSDCKIQGPILAKLLDKYRAEGLTMVAPTQRYGYIEAGSSAPADEELRHIVSVRDTYYPFLSAVPVPLSENNHKRYGVSSTPTLVIVDRRGIITLYHPGRMTESELDQAVTPLLDSRPGQQ